MVRSHSQSVGEHVPDGLVGFCAVNHSHSALALRLCWMVGWGLMNLSGSLCTKAVLRLDDYCDGFELVDEEMRNACCPSSD